tara:strand:+ start:42 stop:386 length:345 start_codon:yes stop_codon:yes gene_type:complete
MKIMFDTLFLTYVSIIIIFELAGQYLFKRFHINKGASHILIVLGMLSFSISSFFVFKILKYGTLGITNIIWHLVHFLAIFLIGYYVFGEKLTTTQGIAVLFGIISIVMFMLNDV